MRSKLITRFLKYVKVEEGKCWLWLGGKNWTGYGQFGPERGAAKCGLSTSRLAHRWSYHAFKGPIPKGMQLDHLCRNKLCVNPDHLEPVTNRENVLRGVGPSAVNARKQACIHGHEFTPENTMWTVRNGTDRRRCRTCDRHNVKMGTQRRKTREVSR